MGAGAGGTGAAAGARSTAAREAEEADGGALGSMAEEAGPEREEAGRRGRGQGRAPAAAARVGREEGERVESEGNFLARSRGRGTGRGPGRVLQPVHLQAGGGVGASTCNFFYGFRGLGVPLYDFWTLKPVKKRLFEGLRVPLDML